MDLKFVGTAQASSLSVKECENLSNDKLWIEDTHICVCEGDVFKFKVSIELAKTYLVHPSVIMHHKHDRKGIGQNPQCLIHEYSVRTNLAFTENAVPFFFEITSW